MLWLFQLNLIFLSNILRILMTQLQSHPNEPGNFRYLCSASVEQYKRISPLLLRPEEIKGFFLSARLSWISD